MAFDKVIDSAELDANLTAVANAIRTKGGTTEPLVFPDGFVSAVEGIQAGGGNSLLSGSFTPVELVNSITLEFERPISNIIIAKPNPTLGLGFNYAICHVHIPGVCLMCVTTNLTGNSNAIASTVESRLTISDDGMKVTASSDRNYGTFEYQWIAW